MRRKNTLPVLLLSALLLMGCADTAQTSTAVKDLDASAETSPTAATGSST